jgi:hypothetical protein
MGFGIPMNSAWPQQDGHKPHTINKVISFLRNVFEERVLSNGYYALLEKGFSLLPTSSDLHLGDYFLWGYLEEYNVLRNLHIILGMKAVIQSQIGAFSTEILTNILNKFVVCLHKVCDILGHHMERILV